MDIRISPEVVLARERGSPRRGIIFFLSVAVAFMTVVLLINPVTTQEYAPVCGLEEHEHSAECTEIVKTPICPWEETEGHLHGEECWEQLPVLICALEENEEHRHTEECWAWEPVLVCTLPEGQVHEHTEDCIVWEESWICGLEGDPEHVHTDECLMRTPVFVCWQDEGVGHVHNDLCMLEETVYTCGLTAHVHTEECYPKLTGDPHADVEIDLDWESSFCDVNLTGNWADDLIAIARSQIGYAESERNFVTDEYNVRHGYTRYGDWNGTRYSGWNGLYVMFCLHYAGVWTVPTDPVPANWMNSARSQGMWTERDSLPARGDLAFFDDNADGFADRVAIVTEVWEDGFNMISGGTGRPVEEETVPFRSDKLVGYLALPQNPDFVTLEEETGPTGEEGTDLLQTEDTFDAMDEKTIPGQKMMTLADPYAPVTLTAETEDGIKATLNAIAAVLPYPAEELMLMVRNAEEAADLTGIVESDGAKIIDVRWLDISIWHEEPVPAETGEPESWTDQTDPVPDADPVSGDSALQTSDALPEETGLTDDTLEASEETEFKANTPDAPDIASLEVEPTTEIWGAEEPDRDPVPEDSEAPAQTRLVQIEPTGPVEITLEGLSEDGSIWVYRMTDDGAVEKAAAEQPDGTRGSISVTIGLN